MEEVVRVRLPREDEVLGFVVQTLGSNRLKVNCFDGVERICRIPEKMKKRIWIRIGDLVVVKPWEIQNEKADVIWRYRKPQAAWLKRKGYY
ncbi:MAG: translation initiation factor eIF-1A [Candidatus Hydrothermarchaeota archaeon]